MQSKIFLGSDLRATAGNPLVFLLAPNSSLHKGNVRPFFVTLLLFYCHGNIGIIFSSKPFCAFWFAMTLFYFLNQLILDFCKITIVCQLRMLQYFFLWAVCLIKKEWHSEEQLKNFVIKIRAYSAHIIISGLCISNCTNGNFAALRSDLTVLSPASSRSGGHHQRPSFSGAIFSFSTCT